jgi:hypothetical protein
VPRGVIRAKATLASMFPLCSSASSRTFSNSLHHDEAGRHEDTAAMAEIEWECRGIGTIHRGQ